MKRNEFLDNLFVYKHRKEILKVLKPYLSDKFYNITKLLEAGGVYNIGYGEKSNGKSTAVQMVMCVIFWLYGSESILLRTYNEDFKRGRADGMFNGIPSGFVSYLTKGVYDSVTYRNFKWYFSRFDQESNKTVLCEKPFCHRMCILNAGSSFQFPDVRLIFFDEFISKTGNYQGEFDDFITVISTILRVRTDIQIFMMGNTVNSRSVYFREMGLERVVDKKQPQGTIDVYVYGDEKSTVAVEYCENAKAKINNELYFPFKNSITQMITNGAWLTNIYPHLPYKYNSKDIIFSYFILFEDKQYKCDIICTDKLVKRGELVKDNFDFTYIYESNFDLSVPDDDIIIFQWEHNPKPNYIRRITKPYLYIHRQIFKYFEANKVFYQDNTVGDHIRAYIKLCLGEK